MTIKAIWKGDVLRYLDHDCLQRLEKSSRSTRGSVAPLWAAPVTPQFASPDGLRKVEGRDYLAQRAPCWAPPPAGKVFGIPMLLNDRISAAMFVPTLAMAAVLALVHR